MPQLRRERLALAGPHGPALGAGLCHHRFHLAPGHLARPIGRGAEHVGLPGHQLDRHLATESEQRLHLAEPRGHQPGAIEIHGKAGLAVHALGPASLHRQVAAIEVAAQTLAQLTLEHGEIAGKLGRQVEVAMVDGPDLDPQPPSGHRTFRGAEPSHAVRQG